MIRIRIALAATLLGVAAACADTPTVPDTPIATAADAAALLMAPEDFSYEEIRHPEGAHTWVNRMNARGDLVGDYCGTGFAWCWGFARRGETFETIAYPGSSWTYAYGINERGDVVGIYGDASGNHGYVYSRGEYRTLEAPSGVQTRAYDIAANGTIAGAYRTTGKWQPAMWEGGRFMPLDDLATELGADMAEGFAISTQGAIVGHFTRAGEFFEGTTRQKMYGFVYGDGAVMATLDYPGSGLMSCGWGIGVHGEVLGHYTDRVAGGVTGYVWEDGEYVARLRVPGALSTFPQAITPAGTIAGWAVMASGERIGFIATD